MEILKKLSSENGIELSEKQIELFEKYIQILLKWNRVYNLTSIKKREEIITKHFFDSLTLVKLFEKVGINPVGKEIADFGTGAGFPGVPLKIYYQDKIDLYLIESVGKKCIFLETLNRELNLDFKVICQRAESVERKFDVVLSRATGETFEVLKIGKNMLKENGYIIIMKGKEVEEELRNFTFTLNFKGFPDRKYIVVQKR
ncbi:MAG: 16S rRNA (guanine(527)-N(7))-methyltransferase RsmG [Hydrogenothermaceae bacterium]